MLGRNTKSVLLAGQGIKIMSTESGAKKGVHLFYIGCFLMDLTLAIDEHHIRVDASFSLFSMSHLSVLP